MMLGVRAAEGNDHPPPSHPTLSSSKLTHREGGGWGNLGGGGGGEVGETHLKEEEELAVLEKTSQTADGKFLLGPEAWCH